VNKWANTLHRKLHTLNFSESHNVKPAEDLIGPASRKGIDP